MLALLGFICTLTDRKQSVIQIITIKHYCGFYKKWFYQLWHQLSYSCFISLLQFEGISSLGQYINNDTKGV